MRPLQRLFWIGLLGGAACGAPGLLTGGSRENDVPEYRRMLFVAGPPHSPITARVGEVIQIQPFSFRVLPGFEAARLLARLEGGRVLDYIGEVSTPPEGEGRAARSAFFLVQNEGKTRIELTLVDEEKQPIEGYRLSYEVIAARRQDAP
jgi:hypothetical protein